MRKENANFITKFISEAGSYLTNSDYFAFVELKDYACYVIADGIDIDEKKESAKLAITTVISSFSDNPGMSGGKLKQYMKAAHQALLDEAQEIRLEASMVILLTDYKKVMWAHVGNSRLYWLKNGNIKMSTKDTSLTQKMVDEEEIPIDQLAYHEERNNLYAYLGQPGRFTPVISAKKKLEDGDILVLMTRGVWENVGEAELIDAIDGVSKAEDVCTGLEDVILSQRLEIVENYTIATVFVNKIYNNPKAGIYKKWIKVGISIGAALFAILFSLFMVNMKKTKDNIAKMDKYTTRGIECLQENNYSSADEQFNEAYSVSENIKARENSKNYNKVMRVENYEKFSDYLTRGVQALQEEEYKKAAGLLQSAVDTQNRLKIDFEEDVTGYEKGVVAYHNFATEMQNGVNLYDKADFENAMSHFEAASEIMDNIDDTSQRNAATVWRQKAKAELHMLEGRRLEAGGDDFRSNGLFEYAIKQYELAKDEYEMALKAGSNYASEEIEEIDKKIDSIKDEEGIVSKEEKAKRLVEYAEDAEKNGKYEEAIKYYMEALEIYVDLGDDTKVAEIRGKISGLQEKAASAEKEKSANEEILAAMEALANQNIEEAKKHLNKASEYYNEIGDKDSKRRVEAILNQL